MKRDRIVYYDILRIISIIAVIMIHSIGQNWYYLDVHSSEWHILSFLDSIFRWAVPCLDMLSGALALNHETTIDLIKLYKKKIFKIIYVFAFWSIVYALYEKAVNADMGLAVFCSHIVAGHYHMWFLFMVVGLYYIVSLIICFCSNMKLVRYFLVLSLVFTFGITTIRNLSDIFIVGNGTLTMMLNVLNDDWQKVNYHFSIGYVTYFVAGFYLSQIEISKRIRRVIYVLSALGFISTILLSIGIAYIQSKPYGFYDNFSLNVMLESVGVFVFVKYGVHDYSECVKRILEVIAKYCLGIYIVHVLILDLLENLGLSSLSFHPLLSVPLIACIVFAISFCISAVIHHIPILKKYIV